MRSRTFIYALMMMAVPSALFAQTSSEVTPFVGWEHGGILTIRFQDAAVQDAPAFGVFISFDRGRGRKLDVLLAHEHTTAERRSLFEPPISAGVDIEYAQAGGRYLFQPDQRFDPYIALTAGITRVAAEGGSAVRPSFAGGGGVDIALTRSTSVRLDGRWTDTFAGGSTTIHCSSAGECSGFATGSSFLQFTASTGLVIHF